MELLQFPIGRRPVVLGRAQRSTPVDVGAEVADDVLVEDGGVTLGGVDVLVAEDAATFAAAVVDLYRDEALWNTLSAHGLANVERHFSFGAARTALQRILG